MNDNLYSEELGTSILFLRNLREKLEEVAQYYYDNNLIKGNSKIISVIDDFNIIISGANTIFSGRYDISVFSSLINEMLTAMESSDNILIGDLISYELIPIISNIQDSFESQK